MPLAEISLGPILIEDLKVFPTLLIGLFLVAWLLYRVNIPGSVPYFRELLGERATRIAENDMQVRRAHEEMQKLRDDYALRLQHFEVEERERMEAAVRDADRAHTEIIADAREAAEQLRLRSEEEMARELTRYRIKLRREIVDITLDATEQSVRANSSETVQRQLISNFITRVAGNGAGNALHSQKVAPEPPAGPRSV